MWQNMPEIATNRREIGQFLYQWVRLTRPTVVVDLGTHRGFTALSMAQAVRDIHAQLAKRKYHPYLGHVYTVDYYRDRGQFEQVYNHVVNHELLTYTTLLEGEASTVGSAWANGAVDLLYVDLTNTQQELFGVWDAWSPHLSGKGHVIFVKSPHKNVDDLYAYLYETWCDVITIPTHVEQLELCLVSRE